MEVEALDAVRRFSLDPIELKGIAVNQLGDHLAVYLTAQIAVALRQSVSGNADPVTQFKRLRQLCENVVALRRSDHNAQWLEIERERVERKKKSRNGFGPRHNKSGAPS
jgi:hypothetical protein